MKRTQLIFWGLALAFLVILFVITGCDPFYGDSISTISRASNNIFHSGFRNILYPENLDPGHPITFPLIHAIAWWVLGKSLWVSHFINLSFGLLTLALFIKWGKKLGYGTTVYVSAFLLLITPLFVSQTVNINLHLPLTFFTLGLVYSLQYGRNWHVIFFASAMVLTHLQGLYYLTPVWLWWFFKQSDKSVVIRVKQSITLLWIPGVLFLAWLMYHHSVTGWYLSSPDYSGHRGFPGVKRFVVNLIMADWRIVDYGQIAFWILPIIALVRGKMKWSWDHPFSLFLMLFLFNSIAIGLTTKTGPMHRYLLPCLPFLVMANATFLQHKRFATTGLLALILISGHFWFYPGKVMGDATLSYRSVFPLLKQAKSDFDNETFYTYAPLSNPSKDTYLTNDSSDFVALYDLSLDSVPYVIYSNISGDFSTEEVRMLQQWPCYTYERGYVYLEVYSNPKLVSMPRTNSRRQASSFEKWFINLKHKIKGDDGV